MKRRYLDDLISFRLSWRLVSCVLLCLFFDSPLASAQPIADDSGVLVVKFYGESSKASGEDTFSVEYKAFDDPIVWAEHFFLYARKVAYNIEGDQRVYEAFLGIIVQHAAEGVTTNTNAIRSKLFRLKMVPQRKKALKTCRADFLGNGLLTTKFDLVGGDYYAPMSVFGFLQHIVNRGSDKELKVFSQEIKRLFLRQSGKSQAKKDKGISPSELCSHWLNTLDQCTDELDSDTFSLGLAYDCLPRLSTCLLLS